MKMLETTELNRKIMRRVYFIFLIKTALKPFAIKLYVSLVLIWGLLTNVSVFSVLKNMSSLNVLDFGQVSHFSRYAFMHTELLAQVSFLGIIVLILLFSFSKIKQANFMGKRA